MNKKISALVVVAALAIIFGISAIASTLQVTGHHVRLRWGPSLNSGIYSDSYGNPIYPSKGSYLTWTGRSQNGFFEVRYGSNTLYIAAQYCRVVNGTGRASSNNLPSTVYVCGSDVLLRTGPGKNYSRATYTNGAIVYLQRGQALPVYGQSGDWWRVSYGGNYFYVSKRYARP